MTVPVDCPSCGAHLTLPEAAERFFCIACRRVVGGASDHGDDQVRRRARSWLPGLVAVALLAASLGGVRLVSPGCPVTTAEAERAVMRYVAALTAQWGTRPVDEFRAVSTAPHAATLGHPSSPPRAIFSPYILWLRIDSVETRCATATVSLTVATGYKPALALPRPVEIELRQDRGALRVAAVRGR